jgi:hypothetical protein
MLGAMPPLPQYVFIAWCLVKHRDNFTFTSSDRIATGYVLGDRMIGVRFPAGAENLSLRHLVQTGSGTHPVSYPMDTEGSFPRDKTVGA